MAALAIKGNHKRLRRRIEKLEQEKDALTKQNLALLLDRDNLVEMLRAKMRDIGPSIAEEIQIENYLAREAQERKDGSGLQVPKDYAELLKENEAMRKVVEAAKALTERPDRDNSDPSDGYARPKITTTLGWRILCDALAALTTPDTAQGEEG